MNFEIIKAKGTREEVVPVSAISLEGLDPRGYLHNLDKGFGLGQLDELDWLVLMSDGTKQFWSESKMQLSTDF